MTAFSPMPRFFLNREMVMNKRKKDKKMNDEMTQVKLMYGKRFS
jgi:hypothetical protein